MQTNTLNKKEEVAGETPAGGTQPNVEVPVKTPRIGIVGHMLPNGTSVGVSLPYLTYFTKFGNVIIVNPVAILVEENLDLLVIPGGPDVSTIRYLGKGDKHSFFNQKPDQAREWFDVNMLPKYIEKRIPIFGIKLHVPLYSNIDVKNRVNSWKAEMPIMSQA